MCLPPISRGPSPTSRGKPPPSPSSSSAASGSSSDAPLPLPRKHRRRNSNSASTESDLPSSRIASGRGRPQPSPLRSSAPSRKPSGRRSSRTNSASGSGSVAGLTPSRRSSTRGARDPTRLAPGSPQTASRSPAFSTKSEKPSRSPSKKQHSSQSTSRRKRSETSSAQSPTATPRTPVVAFEKNEKKRPTGEMDGGDRIITMRTPLQGGGMVSGLMVIRPGSSRRGSESGSSRSKGSPRRSESLDGKRERPGSGSGSGSKATTTLVAGPVGLGISLEDSRTPTPTSKAKVERVREIELKQSQIPRISIEAPSPVSKPPTPALQPASESAPEPPVINVPPSKAAPIETYPIMATLVYPTKEELAYQPISRYQVTSNYTPTKTNPPPPPPPTIVRAVAPALATYAVPAPGSAPAATARLPPSVLQYHNPFDTSPASSVHEIPLGHGGTSSLSQKSSAASGSAISIKEPEQGTPITRQISHVANATVPPGSSTSSLVSASSSSTNQSFRSAAPRAPTPDVIVPELSDRKPNYYRYAAPQNAVPKPMKAIMDSPKPPTTARRAGPWDGMPGADPNLGAYYRNAAAAKLREGTIPLVPTSGARKPKGTPIDEKNLAVYFLQAKVQKQKLALEKMKHEESETEDETSASEASGLSEPWVDPNLAAYYRAAEAAKKKKEQEEMTAKATPNPGKALTISPTKNLPNGVLAGRKVFFSGIRRSMPQVFHHAPPPPPAPTPPPATSAISEDGPPQGAASWLKAKMAAGPGESKPAEYWTNPESTPPGAGAEEEFPPPVPPPAPTPPLAREGPAGQPSPGYYTRSPRTGYPYH